MFFFLSKSRNLFRSDRKNSKNFLVKLYVFIHRHIRFSAGRKIFIPLFFEFGWLFKFEVHNSKRLVV